MDSLKFRDNFRGTLSQLLPLTETKLRVNLDQNKQAMINLAPYLSVTALLLSSLCEEEKPWHWYYSHTSSHSHQPRLSLLRS